MALFKRVVGGFRGLFRKTRMEQELDAELVEFLESSVEQKIRAGLSRDQAIRAARMELGSVAAVKDGVRDVGWESVLDSVGQDIRLAIRALLRTPVVSAVAIVSLTLGIGANTAVFSILNAVLLKPLPYPDADRLVLLGYTFSGASAPLVSETKLNVWKEGDVPSAVEIQRRLG